MTGVVDQFVDALPSDWQRPVCVRMLEDIRASAQPAEYIKWGQPYFEADGSAVLKWFCAKRWINIYFFRGRELPDPMRLFEPSGNVKMLTVKVTPSGELNREAFRDLVRAAATLAIR